MKKRSIAKQQKGFFDLGFSLAVLALSGAIAYAATPDQDDRVAGQEAQMKVVSNYQEGERR